MKGFCDYPHPEMLLNFWLWVKTSFLRASFGQLVHHCRSFFYPSPQRGTLFHGVLRAENQTSSSRSLDEGRQTCRPRSLSFLSFLSPLNGFSFNSILLTPWTIQIGPLFDLSRNLSHLSLVPLHLLSFLSRLSTPFSFRPLPI
jgi:hypothetical protein